jgi:L-lactate dehydrogenase complex protein LldG
MRSVRGEVHRLSRADWVAWVNQEMALRQRWRALIGRSAVADAFVAGASDRFEVTRYDRPIEEWRRALFHDIDFSVTGALAGLAETGSLVLWPGAGEPRLMSLVPPLHIAVLEADRLFENFSQLIGAEDWTVGMPTNALLVSGPAKTADIEQTMAYGIHGPKELITLLVE